MSNPMGAALLAALLLVGAACDDGPTALPDLTVASVSVSPAGQTITTGQTMQLTASPKTADGTVLRGRPVAWSSDASDVAAVSAGGTILGGRPGSARISATVEGRTGSVEVTVAPPSTPVGSIVLDTWNADIWVNGRYGFGAVVRTPAGEAHPNPPVLEWSVDNPTVARVDANGRVVGLVPGTTLVRATGGGVQGSAQITVREFLAGTMQFVVEAGLDPDGSPRTVELGTLTWYGDDPVYGTPARELLKGGSVTLQVVDGVVRYWHQVWFDVVVDDGGESRAVAGGSISDRGTVTSTRDPNSDAPMLVFTSENSQNDTFHGRVISGDRIVLRQRLGAAQVLEYAWVRE